MRIELIFLRSQYLSHYNLINAKIILRKRVFFPDKIIQEIDLNCFSQDDVEFSLIKIGILRKYDKLWRKVELCRR